LGDSDYYYSKLTPILDKLEEGKYILKKRTHTSMGAYVCQSEKYREDGSMQLPHPSDIDDASRGRIQVIDPLTGVMKTI